MSAGTENTGFTLSAGYIDTNGFSATNTGAGPFALQSRRRRLPQHQRLGQHRAPLRARPGAGIQSVLLERPHPLRQRADAATTSTTRPSACTPPTAATSIDSWWQSLVRVGVATDNLVIDGSFPGDLDSRQTQATWQNDFTTRFGTSSPGSSTCARRWAATRAFTVDERDIYSAFAGYTGEFGPHALSASVRNDNNSQFDSQTTGAHRLRLPRHPGAAPARERRHRVPRADLLRSVLSRVRQSQPDARGGHELGGRRRVSQRPPAARRDLLPESHRPISSCSTPLTFKPVNVGEASINGVELAYNGRAVRPRAARAPHAAGRRSTTSPTSACRGARTSSATPASPAASGRCGWARKWSAPDRASIRSTSAGQRAGPLRPAQSRGHVLVRAELERPVPLEQRLRRALRAGEGLQHAGQQRVPVGPIHTTMSAVGNERSRPMKIRVTPAASVVSVRRADPAHPQHAPGVRRCAAGRHARVDAAGRDVDPPLARLCRADGGRPSRPTVSPPARLGVPDYCLSPAYAGLVPAYLVVWLCGWWLHAKRPHASLLAWLATMLVASTRCLRDLQRLLVRVLGGLRRVDASRASSRVSCPTSRPMQGRPSGTSRWRGSCARPRCT